MDSDDSNGDEGEFPPISALPLWKQAVVAEKILKRLNAYAPNRCHSNHAWTPRELDVWAMSAKTEADRVREIQEREDRLLQELDDFLNVQRGLWQGRNELTRKLLDWMVSHKKELPEP